MRLDSLCPFILIIAVACGGDDDGANTDGGTSTDAAATDAGNSTGDAGTSADSGPDVDGGTTGAKCRGIANLKCDEAYFCDWEDDSCGTGEQLGTCTPRPTECQPERMPRCGCDGIAYDNACEAHKAGTDVAALSICAFVGPGDAARPR
jgi:hypothetical protein